MAVYVNLDHGHCETTGTTVRVREGKNIVERLRLSGNHEDVIHSALSLTYDQIRKLSVDQIDAALMQSLGAIRIGDDAITQPKDGEYFAYFKVSPEHFDDLCGKSEEAKAAKLTHGKLMAVFLYQLIQNILRYNKDNKELSEAGPDDISLLIGCPATQKWTQVRHMQKYAQLIRSATGIQRVAIIPESRAAMFSTISSAGKAVTASEGVMVYDFGSSTADSTYMLLGRQVMEYSWDLGASLIEEQLLRMAFLGAQRKDPTVNVRENRHALLRTLRKAKEAYFRTGEESDVTCRFAAAGGKTVRALITVDADTMELATNRAPLSVRANSVDVEDGTWQELCRRFLQKGKDMLDANKLPCKTVVLTGGASHMDFIEQLCKEVYGGGVRIERDKNPSYCVTVGLSWVAIADERRDECIEDAKMLLRTNKTCTYALLERSIKSTIYDYAAKVINAETEAWANEAGDALTVRDLEKRITNAFAADKNKNEIHRLVEQKVGTWLSAFKAGASDAINSQSAKIFAEQIAAELLISGDVWERIDASKVPIDLKPNKVMERLDLSGIINKALQKAVFYATTISVAAVLAEFPGVNVLIGLILGWIAQALITDDDKDKPRKQKARLRIAKQMPKILKHNEIIASFGKAVSDAMEKVQKEYDAMVNDMVTTAIDMVMLRRFEDVE